MFTTAIGAFVGALLSLFISIYIEYQRKPKLDFEIEDPPLDLRYQSAPAKEGRFVRVKLQNRGMPRLLKWLGRDAAMHCHGDIQFHHFDGAPVFSRPMPMRWAGSDEPLSHQVMPNGQVKQLFDAAKYNAISYRDCFPGTTETIDVAARFDQDDECYGWCNENYLPGKGWRNLEWKLPKGRYLVRVTVYSAGDKVSAVFKLENSVARQHFRLMRASKEDAKKLM